MKFTITQMPELRLAMATMAKKDVRHYLNGVCIDLKALSGPNQDATLDAPMVATDGIMLAYSPITLKDATDVPLGEDLIFSIEGGAIPLSAKRAEIVLSEDPYQPGGTMTLYKDKSSIPLKVLTVQRIDGTYPQYERVMAQEKNTSPVEAIGLNPVYLATASKAVGDKFGGVKLTFTGDGNSIAVTVPSLPDTRITLMPTRL